MLLFCCRLINLAALTHSEHAGMVPACRHIHEPRSRLLVGQDCSSAGFISGEPGEALLWGRRGGTRNQHQHETSCQQSGGDEFLRPPNRPARCRPPAASAHRFGMGCHYLRCSVQGLFVLHARTLETYGAVWSQRGPALLRRIKPLCWNLANNWILRQKACQARSIAALQSLLELTINIQPPEMPHWHRRSVSHMVGGHQNATTSCWRACWPCTIAKPSGRVG